MSQRTTCACMPLKYRRCILVTLTSRQHFTPGLYTLKKVLCQCDQSAHDQSDHTALRINSPLPPPRVESICHCTPYCMWWTDHTVQIQEEFLQPENNSISTGVSDDHLEFLVSGHGKGPGDGSVQLWREKQIPYLQKKRTERTSVLRGTFKRAAKCSLTSQSERLTKWIPCYQIVSRGSVEQWKYTRKYW